MRDKREEAEWASPHFEDTESKSPHRSELVVVVGLDGATELELLESRSSKQPGGLKKKKKQTDNMDKMDKTSKMQPFEEM